MLTKLGFLVKYLLITIACTGIAFVLTQSLNPLAGLDAKLGVDEVQRRAATLAETLGVDLRGMVPRVGTGHEPDLLKEVYGLRGLTEGARLLREEVPGYYWEVTWRREDDQVQTDRARGSEDERAASQIASMMRRSLLFQFDMRGNLLVFTRTFSDSLKLPAISPDSARHLGETYVRRLLPVVPSSVFGRMDLSKAKEVPRVFRVDHEFEWTGRDSLLGNTIRVTAIIAGSTLSSVSVHFEVDQTPKLVSDKGSTYREIVFLLLFVVLFLIMIVMAFKRSRAYEIGFRMGIILGVTAAVMFGIEMYSGMPPVNDVKFLISLFIGSLAFGLVIALTWSVAESLGREVWREKFTSLDLTTKGYFLHSRVGESVVRGVALGAVYHLAWILLIGCLALVTSLWFKPMDKTILGFLTSFSPGIALLLHDVYADLFTLSVLIVFGLSLLRRWFTKPIVIILVGGLALGIATRSTVQPVVPAIIIDCVAAILIAWVFFRYDVLTTYTTLVTGGLLQGILVLLRMSDPSMLSSGETVLGLIALVLALAWIAVLTKDRLVDLEAITPAFTRHITERERLQQELQIAREVQMSLLPKKIPEFPGLDIASRCVPALEVGGDYYDFIRFTDTRLGVIVGDVSGKGTEGAFYMTLTKGFLKAVTRAMESPARILTEANSLFYENVDRGTFITVIYGVFDSTEKTVTVARAGHNPAIVIRAGATGGEFVQPSGIALGLEPGEVFGKAIEEVKLSYSSGDVFLFYTDGFGEATNGKGEQFGDEKLMATVRESAERPAAEILEAVLKSVRSFVGSAKQHDDMTIVVVKCS
jgi:sigma-B regulation protein RsbU (phosphoserine phosphatase)